MQTPPVKWTGSKRYIEQEILELFPQSINTYYEPFVGGGSILLALLRSNIEVKSVVASDINSDLINLWIAIRDNPTGICHSYSEMWEELQRLPDEHAKNKYFIDKREQFNSDKETSKFLFLNRTSYNGLIRYNKSGKYNAPYHWKRPGIEPYKLLQIFNETSRLLLSKKVVFKQCDYCESLKSVKEGDFAFFDPPYFDTKAIYSCGLSFDSLCESLRKVKCNFILSYNGTRDDKQLVEIPSDIYDRKVLLKESISGFSQLKGKSAVVREYAYIKGKYNPNVSETNSIWD